MTAQSLTDNLLEVIADGSNDPLKPTVTRAQAPGLRIVGQMSAGDPDYFYIDVPQDMILSGIWLERYASVDPVAFYALQAGASFSAGLDTTKMFAWNHLYQSDVGKNLLAQLPLQSLDDFVLWIQQTGALTEYVVVVSFDPKPGKTIVGSNLSERLTGTDASELVKALEGDDTIVASLRSDTIDGGLGRDTVIYKHQRSDYRVTKAWDGSMLVNAISTTPQTIPPLVTEADDTLINIERVQFSDLSLAFEGDEQASAMARVILTLFGKEGLANRQLTGAAMYLADQGYSIKQIAAVGLPYAMGQASDSQSFIKKLWFNLTGVLPEVTVVNDLAALVDLGPDRGGLSREEVVHLAANLPWTGELIELIGLWNTGLVYEPWHG